MATCHPQRDALDRDRLSLAELYQTEIMYLYDLSVNNEAGIIVTLALSCVPSRPYKFSSKSGSENAREKVETDMRKTWT